jgi:hypothetical protein
LKTNHGQRRYKFGRINIAIVVSRKKGTKINYKQRGGNTGKEEETLKEPDKQTAPVREGDN